MFLRRFSTFDTVESKTHASPAMSFIPLPYNAPAFADPQCFAVILPE